MVNKGREVGTYPGKQQQQKPPQCLGPAPPTISSTPAASANPGSPSQQEKQLPWKQSITDSRYRQPAMPSPPPPPPPPLHHASAQKAGGDTSRAFGSWQLHQPEEEGPTCDTPSEPAKHIRGLSNKHKGLS